MLTCQFQERSCLPGSTTSRIWSLCKSLLNRQQRLFRFHVLILSPHSGDSCHPMLPYLAQGANSAVEDGAVLGQVLGHVKSKDQVPKALEMYQRLRKARGEAIARETFKQVREFKGDLGIYNMSFRRPANEASVSRGKISTCPMVQNRRLATSCSSRC